MRAQFLRLSFLLLFSFSALSQTTVQKETSNNTSAASSFIGWIDARTNASDPILTNPFDMVPLNVSEGRGTSSDVHSLMYSGFSGKLLVETQAWFCTTQNSGSYQPDPPNGPTFPQCNSHNIVGYNSYDATQASNMVDDMYRRGFDGFVSDISGGSGDCGYPNFNSACGTNDPNNNLYLRQQTAVQNMRNRVNTNYSASMNYAIMEDQSAFKYSQNCAAYLATTTAPKCIELRLEADLRYFNTQYFGDATYLKDPSTGQPILMFFIQQGAYMTQCTSQAPQCQTVEGPCISSMDCWNGIFTGMRNQGIAARFVFYNSNGFTNPMSATNGAFGWIIPNSAYGTLVTTATQEDWKGTSGGGNNLDFFYQQAKSHTSDIAVGFAYKGYDAEDASFHQRASERLVMSQQCGQVWLNTFNEPTVDGFNSGAQLGYMMAETWDDYEEGTEIETGIDNCVNSNSFQLSINSSTLSWNLQFSDSTYGTPSTIDHYILYYTTDGTNLYAMDSNITPGSCTFNAPTVSCSVNLKNYSFAQGVNYTLYVKEVSKPSIVNHFSANSVTYLIPASKTVQLTPTSVGFGGIPLGQSSAPQYVTVKSSGAQAVNITSIGASGDFAQTNNCPSSLAGGSTCTVTITFTPTAAGSRSGTLTVQSDASNGTQTASLVGFGGCLCNIDDLSGWAFTDGLASGTLTQNVASPSKDGASAQFSLTGGPSYSHAKWENQLGLNDSASHFTLDLWAYVDNPTHAQGIDFGFSQMIGGSDFAFHFDCNLKGNPAVWQVWNAASNSWSVTTIPCTTSTFPANTWVHLTFDAQRTTGGQLQYNWLSVNGTQSSVNQTFNPNQEGPDNVEVSLTLYGDANADPFSVWVDSMSLAEATQ